MKKQALKLYLLTGLLWCILLLLLSQNQSAEMAIRILPMLQEASQAVSEFFHYVQTPRQAETQVHTEVPRPPKDAEMGPGDTLRMLHPSPPAILNPHLSSALQDWEPCRLTYEPLASADSAGRLIPILAEDIPSLENGGVAADGKSVTWKLKKGVQWSDGEPFTADDVVFTYEFDTNPDVQAVYAANYAIVARVQASDPYTVTIMFHDPAPAWSLFFVGAGGVILPRHVFEPYNGANALKAPANILPVGTGPYRVVPPGLKPQEVLLLGTQIVETKKIVFEPNPYFREPDRYVFQRIDYRGGGTDKEAARLVLQEGKADYAFGLEGLSPDILAEFMRAGKGRLLTNFGPGSERVLLNHTDPNRETPEGERSSVLFPHPFFSDKKVRQAFAHAIDRETLASMYGGRPTTNNLVAPPQYSSATTFYEFNLQKAGMLLDETGWIDHNGDGIRDKDGQKMKVIFQSYVKTTIQHAQQAIKQALESLGIEVEIKLVDASLIFKPGHPDHANRFNADLLLYEMLSDYFEPGPFMQFWTCSQIPQKANNWSGLNVERWCNAEYDALYQQSTRELDPEKRQHLFRRMNAMLSEDVVMIPTVHMPVIQGVSRTLEGLEFTPWDMKAWNIQDWRRVSE